MTAILGLSAFYHDSAAALIVDGTIVAAAQEERFTRHKHDVRFPAHAAAYTLAEAGLFLDDLDAVAFYERPSLKSDRIWQSFVADAPRNFRAFSAAFGSLSRSTATMEQLVLRDLHAACPGELAPDSTVRFHHHHESHAASAFFPSPFDEALVLTVDGVGEWATTTVAVGKGDSLEPVREIRFPHSLGLLYSAFTRYCGFRVNSGEYKLMGLAPYGRPRYRDLILDELVHLFEDGSFALALDYFPLLGGRKLIGPKFEKLFGQPMRESEAAPLTTHYMDVAASIQAALEVVMLTMTRSLAAEFGLRNLCMAGGVALNCVANGQILRDGHFDDIWIQPAAGDAGGALGAALATWHGEFGGRRAPASGCDAMQGAYLGPGFDQAEIDAALADAGAVFKTLEPEDVIETTAAALGDGAAVGWFQGRMEFGPRALGNRSILADPRRRDMQQALNLKVKFRESFRPFAPVVLESDAADWFELDRASPYMLLVANVSSYNPPASREDDGGVAASHARRREELGVEQVADRLRIIDSAIPAVTHVDGSARVQTINAETNRRLHDLLVEFKRNTGCPVLVNTSFNIRGEPIVASVEDAYRCFMSTDLDMLVCGDSVLYKADQDPELLVDVGERLGTD